MMTKTNYYYILPFNSWPLMLSFNSFSFMISLLMFLKYGFFYNFIINVFNITYSSFLWWYNYNKELNIMGLSSFNLDSGIKFSVILFIFSEIFFFFSLFWSYFHFFLSPTTETGTIWPSYMVQSFEFYNVPLVNTLLLLSSGVTVTISHMYMTKGFTKNMFFFLFFTILLGLMFSYFQYLEYSNSFFSFSDGTFGSTFFFLTGFHGLHVLLGTLFLSYSLYLMKIIMTTKDNYITFELASWYWHFVDVVWIFLYYFLYYINNI